MQKQISLILVLSVFACVALAIKNDEPEEVKRGASNAFAAGLARFSGAIANGDNEVPVPGPSKSRVYSLYSKGLTPLGGGKPHLVEQYRKHLFVGPTTTLVPEDHHIISDTLTPEQTAELTKPRPIYQHSTDQLYIP